MIYKLEKDPDKCGDCPLSVLHLGKTYCAPLKACVPWDVKDDRCPLEEVDEDERFD